MEYVLALAGLMAGYGFGYYFGMRRRRPEGESLADTARIMLAGPTTKPNTR